MRVEALVGGATLPPIVLEARGDAIECYITAFTAGRIGVSVAERMAAAARAVLERRTKAAAADRGDAIAVRMETVHEPPERALGDGCGILMVARTSMGCLLGASGLGERGVPAEVIGQRAADELADVLESGACVDDWMLDQLVIFMAAAAGESVVVAREPTLHARTAMAVAEQLTAARFECAPIDGGGGGAEGAPPGLWRVTCRGAALKAGKGGGDL